MSRYCLHILFCTAGPLGGFKITSIVIIVPILQLKCTSKLLMHIPNSYINRKGWTDVISLEMIGRYFHLFIMLCQIFPVWVSWDSPVMWALPMGQRQDFWNQFRKECKRLLRVMKFTCLSQLFFCFGSHTDVGCTSLLMFREKVAIWGFSVK